MIANQEIFDLAVALKNEMSRARDTTELQAIARRIEAMGPNVLQQILLATETNEWKEMVEK